MIWDIFWFVSIYIYIYIWCWHKKGKYWFKTFFLNSSNSQVCWLLINRNDSTSKLEACIKTRLLFCPSCKREIITIQKREWLCVCSPKEGNYFCINLYLINSVIDVSMLNLVETALNSFHGFYRAVVFECGIGIQSNLVCLCLRVQYVWAWERNILLFKIWL